MKMLPVLCLILTLIILAGVSFAQEEIPDNPVGEKLEQLLNAFESTEHETFISKNFSPGFLNQFPMDDHISFFRQVQTMHGGFSFYELRQGDDYSMSAIVKSKKRDAWRLIELEVESNPPHKIMGLGIDMAQPPADIPYSGAKHDLVSKLQPDDGAVVDGEVAAKIDSHMTNLEERGYSGAVFVARGGKILLSKGYGYADREHKIPFHTQSAFDIGSITKQFTGAAILKLEMMGKLDTGDKISEYFDDVPPGKSRITLHHLLTHSAGFTDALGFDYSAISREDYFKLAMESELLFEPGESHRYSNVGYSILAAVIELVTEQSYDRFLQDNLFKPCGMNSTGYLLPDWGISQVVHGYRGADHFGQPNEQEWADDGPWWHLRGNGGIISTVGDMYTWHLALAEEKILSAAAKKKYYTPHIVERPGGDTYYGYGWVITQSSRGTKVYMHNGGNPYFANDCFRYVEDDVFVYLTSNNGELAAIEQSSTVLGLVFGL